MKSPRIAVFPGTFDPITYGHLDVIERGVKLFDGLIVGVSQNSTKRALIPIGERVDLIRRLTARLEGVRVETFSGMTVDFVRRVEAHAILRGIRTFADFEYEFQLALANRRIADIETVFVMASAENAFVRSTLIKEAASLGGDISAFVPPEVGEVLERYAPAQGDDRLGLGGREPTVPGPESALQGEVIE